MQSEVICGRVNAKEEDCLLRGLWNDGMTLALALALALGTFTLVLLRKTGIGIPTHGREEGRVVDDF